MHTSTSYTMSADERRLAASCLSGLESLFDDIGARSRIEERTADLCWLTSGSGPIDQDRYERTLRTLDEITGILECQSDPAVWHPAAIAFCDTPESARAWADGMASSRATAADRSRQLATSLRTATPAPGEEELADRDWLAGRYYAGDEIEAIAGDLGVKAAAVRAAMRRHGIATRAELLTVTP